jgi:uncharacterized protein YbjT (DUF2867 family)
VNLVLGATGKNGGEVVRVLRAMKQPVRAIVRDPAKAKGLTGDGVEVVAGDLADPGGLERAYAGGAALFLLAPVAPNQADLELDALRAARAAGVRRVVKLSAIGADPLARGHFSRSHGIGEAALMASGLGWTIVRGAFFYSNLLFAADAIQKGVYAGHWGKSAAAWVDTADLAEVCARCMVEPQHAGATLIATGPAAFTNDELVAVVGRELGKAIRYEDRSPEAHEKVVLSSGAPAWYAQAEVALGDIVRSGLAREVTGTVARITGHPPRPLAEWLRANASAFR